LLNFAHLYISEISFTYRITTLTVVFIEHSGIQMGNLGGLSGHWKLLETLLWCMQQSGSFSP